MVNTLFLNKYAKHNKASMPLIIGFFDGLHKGHLQLFRNLKNGQFNILTFLNVPNKSKNFVYNDSKRIEELKLLLPHQIFLLDLSKHNMLAMSFVYKLLKTIKPSLIIIGSDFRFGKNRHGDISHLQKYFNVKIVHVNPKYKTTNIRKMIVGGEIKLLNQNLYRPYKILGTVIHGKHLGRKMNYPTANILLDKNNSLPKPGSYSAYTFVGNQKYKSAVFIRGNILESHIFNFNKNIYGKRISIQLIQYKDCITTVNSNMDKLKKIISQKIETIKESFY
ncbi:MAG: hypothetical protein LBF00_03530 [Mycoplasmataceae bacterium]|jgi:riboflavin kinase/FMN adenylyltransferase|nr:hypothetical protein [Mycoplasmataceae bacterium]